MQVALTFLVLDWDGPLVGDNLLGVAKFTLPEVLLFHYIPTTFTLNMHVQGSSEVVQHRLTLQTDKGVKLGSKHDIKKQGSNQDLTLGTLTVSVVFRPVTSVGKSNTQCHVTSIGGAEHQSRETASGTDGYGGQMKYLKKRQARYHQQG